MIPSVTALLCVYTHKIKENRIQSRGEKKKVLGDGDECKASGK